MAGEYLIGAFGDPPLRYEIRVRGHLGGKMRSAFPALQAMRLAMTPC